MVFAVLAIVAVTYYAVVISNYGPQLLEGGAGLAVALPILIAFHVLVSCYVRLGVVSLPNRHESLTKSFSYLQLVVLLWCYFMTVFTDPGSVPEHWRPAIDEEDLEAQAAPLSGTPRATTSSDAASVNGSSQFQDIRFCRKCSQYKPPRTHHCSVCKYWLPCTLV